MNTRYADDPDAPLAQHRYMSSPEYVEARGIGGSEVTAKASLTSDPAKRSLLFFLQAFSLKPAKPGEPGGLKKFCRDFLATFPERIGTPTMRKLCLKAGQKYTPKDAFIIDDELFRRDHFITPAEIRERTDAFALEVDTWEDMDRCLAECNLRVDADHWHEQLRQAAHCLPDLIVQICVNPSIAIPAPGETARAAGLVWFKDLFGALYEFQRRYTENIRREFVMTATGKPVFDSLDFCLCLGGRKGMVLVEGESGLGKTTAAEAWTEMHLGEARFVTLSGLSHKTGIFRAIAKTLGLPSSYSFTATDLQARVEDMLVKSRLVLVLDESHFLLNSAERVYSRPEIVDWINTSLYNNGVHVAMVCTPQFLIRLNRVAQQTSWNADQLRRRVKRFTRLPLKPTADDLRAVALKHLPDATRDTIQYLVGYAMSSKLHFPAIVDAIDEARLLAARSGRDNVTFDDIETAIRDYCAQSALAWQRPELQPARISRRRPLPSAPALETDFEGALSGPKKPVTPSRKTNLTGLKPAPTSSTGHRAVTPVCDLSQLAEK